MSCAVHNLRTIIAIGSPLSCVVSVFLLEELWAQVFTTATGTVTTCASLFMLQASSHCSSGKGYIVSTFHLISFHILSVDLIIKVLLWQRDLSIYLKALPFNGDVDSSSRRH